MNCSLMNKLNTSLPVDSLMDGLCNGFSICHVIVAWLSSLASLLFASKEDEDKYNERDGDESCFSLPDIMFCYYEHSGLPTQQDGKPIMLEGLMTAKKIKENLQKSISKKKIIDVKIHLSLPFSTLVDSISINCIH